MNAKMRRMAEIPNRFRVPDQQNTISSRFPVELLSTDGRKDEEVSLRAQLVNNQGIVPGVGLATAGDDYFNYAAEKREKAQAFEFYSWIMSNADLSAPEKAAWWFEKFPWMRTLREQEIDRQAKIQADLAKIAISGPQSEDDFMLLFLKQNDLLGDVDKPLQKLNEMKVSDNFKQGMYSVFSRPANLLLAPNPPLANSTGVGTNKINYGNPLGPPTAGSYQIPGFGFQKDRLPLNLNPGQRPLGGI